MAVLGVSLRNRKVECGRRDSKPGNAGELGKSQPVALMGNAPTCADESLNMVFTNSRLGPPPFFGDDDEDSQRLLAVPATCLIFPEDFPL
jgi:hypothetical protein